MPIQVSGAESGDCPVHYLQRHREYMVAILEACLSRERTGVGRRAYEYGVASGFYGRDG